MTSTNEIYAVVNTKGGVGKTTTAVNLSVAFARLDTTLLVDGDPQGSAASWASWRRDSNRSPSPTTAILTGKAILTEGKPLSTKYRYTIVDAGGRDSAGLRSALLLAQHAIVPVTASNLDAAAMTDLLEIISLARDYNPDLRVRVLLTRVDTRTRDTKDMLEFLAEQKLDVYKTRICERVAYRRAVGDGASVDEFGRDAQATEEMNAFFNEVKAHDEVPVS